MSWPVMTYCLPSMTKRLVEPCRCISTVMGALFPFAFYWNLSAPLACAFSAWWIHYSPPFFFFLSQVRAFPKNQVTVSVFCPLYEVFFSLFLGRHQKMLHCLICFKQHFSISLDLCILDSKQSWHLAYLFIYVEEKTCSCLTSFN